MQAQGLGQPLQVSRLNGVQAAGTSCTTGTNILNAWNRVTGQSGGTYIILAPDSGPAWDAQTVWNDSGAPITVCAPAGAVISNNATGVVINNSSGV